MLAFVDENGWFSDDLALMREEKGNGILTQINPNKPTILMVKARRKSSKDEQNIADAQ